MAELPDKLYVTASGVRISGNSGPIDNYLATSEPSEHEDGTEVGVYKLMYTRTVSKKTTLKRPDNTTETDNGDE